MLDRSISSIITVGGATNAGTFEAAELMVAGMSAREASGVLFEQNLVVADSESTRRRLATATTRHLSFLEDNALRFVANREYGWELVMWLALVTESYVFAACARELISWAIGVTMGRYSVDVPGLVLADQASSLDDFRARVPEARLQPDDDGIIPVTGGAFDDDASRRVKAVLRVVFGASDLGDNIEFLTRCLAVKPGSNTAEFVPPVIPADPERALDDYMAKSFAADHQKYYSGRPVYWSLESPKGTFRALIYLHRYTPDTVGQVLTKYASPFVDRLKAESEAVGRERDAVMGDDRKADRERARIDKKRSEIDAKVAEVQGFIDSVLQPLAQRRIRLDLDDGVRINRLKLAYGWRSDLADLPQSAIGAATSEVKKGIATDLKWARGEIKKNNVWWS